MQILTNISKSELAYLTSQPTAKALIEKNKSSAINIPKGDAQRAAAFAATRETEKQEDSLQLSDAGLAALQKTLESGSKGIRITKSDNNYNILFKNPAYAHRAIKQGYIDVDGEQLVLSEDDKLKLRAAANDAFNQMQRETLQATAEHNAHVLKQQMEAIRSEADKTNEVLQLYLQMMNNGKPEKKEDEWVSPLKQLQNHSVSMDYERTKDGFSLKSISITDGKPF